MADFDVKTSDDEEDRRRHHREQSKAYYQKLISTPEGVQRRRDYSTAHYKRIRSDPDKWAMTMERSRLRQRQPEVAQHSIDVKRHRRQTDPTYRQYLANRSSKWAYGISQSEAGLILLTLQHGRCAIFQPSWFYTRTILALHRM